MSAILRAIRPKRNDIKKATDEKPQLRVEFQNGQERDQYYFDLILYRDNLMAKKAAFYEMYLKLLTITASDEASQKTLDDYAENDSTLLIRVDEIVTEIGLWIKAINERKTNDREKAERERDRERLNESLVTRAPSTTIRLPQLELKKFAGNVTQWEEFWDAFESSVDKNDALSPVDKFNYLKSQLVGEARAAITGLSLTNENYNQAVEIMKNRFGNRQVVINSHYTVLTQLQPATEQTGKIRFVVDTIEKHLRSLDTLGQDINHDHFVSMILSKLPRDFVCRLEESREGNWTVTSLRKKIQTLLAAREIADRHLHTTQPSKPRPTGNITTNPTYRSSTGTLHTSSKSEPITPKCHFCKEQHWSDECRQYTTVDARKAQVKGHCTICLRKGHTPRDCRSQKVCVHCGQQKRHHRSLCPKKFQTASSTESPSSRENDEAAEALMNTSSNMSTEKTMLSSSEKGLLQTAKATVYPVDDKAQRSAVVRVLLDTGSQRTYVTKDLVKKLGITPYANESLSISTFGSDKPKIVNTYRVKLKLKLLDDGYLDLTATVIPKINEDIQVPPVNMKMYGS